MGCFDFQKELGLSFLLVFNASCLHGSFLFFFFFLCFFFLLYPLMPSHKYGKKKRAFFKRVEKVGEKETALTGEFK